MSILDPGLGHDLNAPVRRYAPILRAVALLASIVSLASLWFSEKARVRDDLQLAMDATARPGERLAMRAFYLRDVEAPEGPSLASAPVSVRLLDERGRQIAQSRLRAAVGDASMEGELQLPANVVGRLQVEARSQLEERSPVACRRSLEVFAQAPQLAVRYREAPILQQLNVGSLRSISPEGQALNLEPRIVGGACVPEQRCTLLVWVGGEGASLRLSHNSAVSAKAADPSTSTRGLVSFSLTVHGPEAVIVLEAHRAQKIAERTVRLAVGLGQPLVATEQPLVETNGPAQLRVALPPGRTTGFLEVFVRGRWRGTRAFRAGAPVELPLAQDWRSQGGLIRAQAHTDRFGGDSAGSRVVYVRSAGESGYDALLNIARELRASGLGSPLTDGWVDAIPQEGLAYPQQTAAFLLASFEHVRLALPQAATSRPRELMRLSRAQSGLRYGVGGVLVLSALLVGITLMRRGLSAQREAEAILEEAELELGSARNNREGRSVLFVVCLVLVVCLGFLAAALLIVAKPLWF